MEGLIKSAAIAWNPVGAARARLLDGTLSVESVLLPFLGVVIACNLFAVSAQKFFYEALLFALGTQLGDHPLLGEFSQRVLAAIGPIVPALAVAVLPARTFGDVGRNAVVASVFIVAAGWAFYGAAVSAPIYFVAGIIASVDPDFGLKFSVSLLVPAIIIVWALVVVFWVKVFRRVLALPRGSVALMSAVAIGSLLGLFLIAWMTAGAIFGV